MAKTAGYSERSLVDKLGIKASHRAHFASAPADYDTTLGPLPEGVILVHQLRGQFDFIQFFTDRRANLERVFPSPQEGAEEGRYVV